jgi:hypothetical protein
LGDLELCRRLAGLFDPIHDRRCFNCTQAGSIRYLTWACLNDRRPSSVHGAGAHRAQRSSLAPSPLPHLSNRVFAGMSTFSRSLPAWMRISGGDAPEPSQAIKAASAPPCLRATAAPRAKHFLTRPGSSAEDGETLHPTAKEAVSRNGQMNLRASGIKVSQPQDGPEWVKP